MEKGMGEGLGCDVRREGQIRPFPQGMIGSRRISSEIFFHSLSLKSTSPLSVVVSLPSCHLP